MTECERKGKWIRGCSFKARYDMGVADLSQFKTISGISEEAIEAFRPKTYVHDVCVTCGKVVDRSNPETSEGE